MAVTGRTVREVRPAFAAGAFGPALARCADTAQTRGEPIAATAVPYRRYLLLEVPGPWGAAALGGRQPAAAELVDRAAADADVQVLLIRRPGRQRAGSSGTSDDRPRAWALADTTPGAERVLWGSWHEPDDLRGLDLTAAVPALATRTGPQKVALTCTNGKRDLCCAVRGRPVAEALTEVAGWDSWESSHLGGHRFAATVMLLPTGDMFGWLDPETAGPVVRRFDAGQFPLAHYRGRSGQPLPVQTALHAAAVRLGDSRRHAFEVTEARQPAGSDRWEILLSQHTEPGREVAYRVTVAPSAASPALLSCSDDQPKTEVRYTAISLSRVSQQQI